MAIAFKTHNSLKGLKLLPIFLHELLPITLGGRELSFAEGLPTVFHLQKLLEDAHEHHLKHLQAYLCQFEN